MKDHVAIIYFNRPSAYNALNRETLNELDRVINAIQPNVLTKGSDYASTDVLGRELVESYGGRIELIPIAEDVSATKIIDSIKKKC